MERTASGGSGPDRTALAVRRQLEAMGCERFGVGILVPDGKMRIRTWTKDEVLEVLPWLKRQNALGADGLEPALVVEMSLLNYQAWIRLSDKPLELEVATLLARSFAQVYAADQIRQALLEASPSMSVAPSRVARPTTHETGVKYRCGVRHGGRFVLGATSPYVSWTRGSTSTPYCHMGSMAPEHAS